MQLKNLVGDILLIAVVTTVAVGVYRFVQLPTDNDEKSARYQDPYEGTGENEGDSAGVSLEDCERFIDTTMAQSCRESRKKRLAQDN